MRQNDSANRSRCFAVGAMVGGIYSLFELLGRGICVGVVRDGDNEILDALARLACSNSILLHNRKSGGCKYSRRDRDQNYYLAFHFPAKRILYQ
jgi:hypothetical protein